MAIPQTSETVDKPAKKGRGRPREWEEGSNWRGKMPEWYNPPPHPTDGGWEDEVVGWGEQDQDAWETLRRAQNRGGSRYDHLDGG